MGDYGSIYDSSRQGGLPNEPITKNHSANVHKTCGRKCSFAGVEELGVLSLLSLPLPLSLPPVPS